MDNTTRPQCSSVDYLSVRLRRIVRSVIESERTKPPSTWLAFITSKEHPLVLKVLRSLAFAICIAVFLTQVHDRISYYLTYPVETDVHIKANTEEPYPEMTICHDPSETTQKLYDELNATTEERKGSSLAVEAISLINRTMPLENVWRRVKTSDDIVFAKLLWNSMSEDLAYTDTLMLYGTCATFHQNSTIPMQNANGKFDIVFLFNNSNKYGIDYAYVHESEEYPTSQYEHEPTPGTKNIVRISIKKYNFQHRNSHPCVSSSEHRKCVRDCFISFSNEKAGCRVPFQPLEVKLPHCGPITARHVWYRMQGYLRGREYYDCTCTRKCKSRIFDSSVESVESYVNKTVYILEYSSAHITIISERLAYKFVNLLADIGGNSGLWVGLSVLSIIDFLPLRRKAKKNQHSFSPTDPLYRIVLKKIGTDFKNLNFHLIRSPKQSFNIMKYLLIGIVCLLFGYAVFNRISVFFQYPVRTVVDITFMQTILSASVTICPGNKLLESLQKQYANDNNIADFCEVKIWQLVDEMETNASILWTRYNESDGKIEWASSTTEYLHDGVCFNVLNVSKPSNAKKKDFFSSTQHPLCGENYMKMYIKPPTGYYDYSLYGYVTQFKKHSVSYTLKRIAAHGDDKECITESSHESCKASCLTTKLWQKVNCWLPFMPTSNLPLCDSPITAKHSLHAYLELFAVSGSSADCNCLPPCYKHIYDVAIEAEDFWTEVRLSVGFGTRHNIMETYTKVRTYPVVAFLCDIGGWLGSTLGLCVFGVGDIIFSAANILKKQRSPKKHEIGNRPTC